MSIVIQEEIKALHAVTTAEDVLTVLLTRSLKSLLTGALVYRVSTLKYCFLNGSPLSHFLAQW